MQNLSTAERLALLELLEGTAPKKAAAATLAQIQPVDRSGPLPLSYPQWRLWFLDQLGIPGALYHIPTRLRLRGELDRDALVRALNRVVARHEALRTTFAEVGAEQVQRIAPAEESPFQLAEHDLRGQADAEAELRRLLAEESAAPFDLARGPLIRGHLIRLADDDQVVHITMHHIVSDGWSMGVFTRELSTLYAAFRKGEPDPLPALPIQYADFAVWQRRWVDGEVLKAQAEYWKRTLAGAPALLELPTDRPRPARQDFTGGDILIELDAEVTAGVKALSRRHGATLYMTFLAAWAVVLGRLSGQEDVVIGTPVAGRGRREIEGLIGFFVNTLAIRIGLPRSLTVADLLRRAKDRALEAQQHQEIPFEQVVELVQPVRSLAHTPLFQVMFNWLNMPERSLEFSGLEQGPTGAAQGPAEAAPGAAGAAQPGAPSDASADAPADASAQFDLTLTLTERGGRIVGALEYATAIFERETMERHVAYLRRVVAQMVADKHRSVGRLELMSPAERTRVVEAWNATELPCPEGRCVHELFERRAEETPGATAVVFEGGELTYAELNARANRLAHRLRALGVGPDARVAICAERTPELVAGLLAVLKAGGAYVPLDPAYPEERLRWLLEDSAPVAVLAHGSLAARFAGAGVPVLELDAGSPAWAAGPETNPRRGALLPEHLAYVIYTSGSTGRPKGVEMTHRGASNLLHWYLGATRITERDSVLVVTSFSFHLTQRNLLAPLFVGGRVHLAREPFEPRRIASQIVASGITMMNLTPTGFQALVEADGGRAIGGLRIVVFGGEPLYPRQLARVPEPRPVFLNPYGSTEATGITAHHFARADLSSYSSRSMPPGRPIANARIYVLDAAGEPVPVGVTGELYLGGAGVTRGYRGLPGHTAERYLPDPFGREPGARLYRTGDLGRWLPDGTIEFMGRGDAQVKVRGFRIELGEIEARLAEHAAVHEAVVVARPRDDEAGDPRLVAYYTGDAVRAAALRAHVAERLPEYMIPAAFVHMDALPVNPNGKLDRKALPAPELAPEEEAYAAPRTPVEEVLAGIWAEVLGVGRVGVEDGFFDLGGHSLLATRVVSRVREVFGVELPLRALFEGPTVAELARAVEDERRRELPVLPPVVPAGRTEPPLSFAQERLWFLDQLRPGEVS